MFKIIGTRANYLIKTVNAIFARDVVQNTGSIRRVIGIRNAVLNPLKRDTFLFNKSAQLTQKGTVLPIEQAAKRPNLIDAYEVRGERFKFFNGKKLFDADNVKFVDEANPKTLIKRAISDEEDVIFISNFDDIHGTIAATTDLSKCIATDRMYQCAGVSIVDRTLNKQTLVHIFPGFSVESNKNILRTVITGSKPEHLEISIVPGCEYFTNDTVAFLAEATKELAPGAKVNFCNFPAIRSFKSYFKDGHVNFLEGESAIWLKNGKLFCCNDYEIPNKIVNPREFLTYFS